MRFLWNDESVAPNNNLIETVQSYKRHHDFAHDWMELNYEKKTIFLNINTPCLYSVKPISVM